MIRTAKGFLLAGASVLAILAAVTEAQAVTITTVGSSDYDITATGRYLIELFAAQGGTGGASGGVGGLGAEVVVEGVFTAARNWCCLSAGRAGAALRAAAAAAGRPRCSTA